MIFSYFDSSVLLSIILEEARQEEAIQAWRKADLRCSSILLNIETLISLRRSYERQKEKLSSNWLHIKKQQLNEYLCEVNYLDIDKYIEQEIILEKGLSYCRTLDAIHIATALQFRVIPGVEDVHIYTFDDRMKELAEKFKFKVNNGL